MESVLRTELAIEPVEVSEVSELLSAAAQVDKKRSMLFLTAELPYPQTCGGRIKSGKLVENFAQEYDLTVACALKYGDEFVADFQKRVDLTEFIHEPVEVPRSAKNLVISYLRGTPLNVYRTYSRKLQERVAQIADQFDLIFVDHYEVAQYVPADYKGKVVLHQHNAYYLMWERFANHGDNAVYRAVCRLEAGRVKKAELDACHRSDMVFASPNDIDSLVEIGFEKEKCHLTYHLGDDADLKRPPLQFDNTEESLLYIGSLGWEPNITGLLEFFEQCWPQLKAQHPDLLFYIVGANPDQRLIDATRDEPNIVLTGFVEDLEEYYARCRVFVVPLRYGAGMKVKVLSALGRGIPTVTTSIGSEGMRAEHMKELGITDKNQDMVPVINRLLRDQELWGQFRDNSRHMVQKYYTWSNLLGSMNRDMASMFEGTQ